METSNVINSIFLIAFNIENLIALAALLVSITSGFIFFAYRSGKFFSEISTKTSTIEKRLDDIEHTLKQLTPYVKKIDAIELKVNIMWNEFHLFWNRPFFTINSPRALNERGLQVLQDSGIAGFIYNNYEELFLQVQSKDTSNAYRAEKSIIMVMQQIPDNWPNFLPDLENCAYNLGIRVDVILFVGALNVRDQMLGELGLLPNQSLDESQ